MHRRYPNFRPMQPYGNVGDRKNDGYIPESGLYFQLYSPSDPAFKLATAAKKAQEDFKGLRDHWQKQCPIKEFRFGFNDEYDGSVVPVENALLAISKKYGVKTSPFLACHLEDEVLQLPIQEIEEILNFLILDVEDIGDADFNALREVVQHVMDSDAADLTTAKLISPDFNEKIQFNGLSPEIADLLRVAGRQTDAVVSYFSRRSATHIQDLRDHLSSVYEKEKKRFAKRKSDAIFYAILDALVPSPQRRNRLVQNAALVVMAFYFEACDLFEEPNVATGKTRVTSGVDPRVGGGRARKA